MRIAGTEAATRPTCRDRGAARGRRAVNSRSPTVLALIAAAISGGIVGGTITFLLMKCF
jgi:hypothetical protein